MDFRTGRATFFSRDQRNEIDLDAVGCKRKVNYVSTKNIRVIEMINSSSVVSLLMETLGDI